MIIQHWIDEVSHTVFEVSHTVFPPSSFDSLKSLFQGDYYMCCEIQGDSWEDFMQKY